MKAQHTPGPWHIRTDSVWEQVCSTVARVGEAHIMAGKSLEPYTAEENIANARLIAAAPELVEACRMLLRVHYDTGSASLAGLDAVNLAEAAIAKASGKDGE